MLDERRARIAVARDDVEHTRRQARLLGDLGEEQRRERGEFGGLQHHRIAEGQRRRHLPGEHQERKVPGNDLTDDAHRLIVGELALLQLRPAGMVIEMARRQRHVEITRLTDRLAIVEAFDDSEETGMALDETGQRIKMTRAAMAAEPGPAGLRLARRLHRRVDIARRSFRQLRQHFAGRGLQRVEMTFAIDPLAGDEVAETLVVLGEPGARFGIALGRRAVIHRIEIMCDAHFLPDRMAVEGRIAAGDVMLELALDIGE